MEVVCADSEALVNKFFRTVMDAVRSAYFVAALMPVIAEIAESIESAELASAANLVATSVLISAVFALIPEANWAATELTSVFSVFFRLIRNVSASTTFSFAVCRMYVTSGRYARRVVADLSRSYIIFSERNWRRPTSVTAPSGAPLMAAAIAVLTAPVFDFRSPKPLRTRWNASVSSSEMPVYVSWARAAPKAAPSPLI
uniref:Uncharacterized protein n=1 Tax=Anopheles maculatus TaxID=74869 RepID=A0A182T8L6_9DIPT